jgi:hypothetical protein
MRLANKPLEWAGVNCGGECEGCRACRSAPRR